MKKGNVFMYWLLMISLIFLAVIVIFAVNFLKITKEFDELKTTTEKQNKEYETEISNLKQKVTLLAEHVTIENENKNIEEAKKNPVGIPVSGQATIISEPKEDETEPEEPEEQQSFWAQYSYEEKDPHTDPVSFEDGLMNPYTLEISVNKGAKIIATGNGVVSEISTDDIYGYIVKVNHQNGYVTVYRYSEAPKVNQGDEVLKGQMLFEVTKNKGTLAYHILYENTYINPFDVIEISG